MLDVRFLQTRSLSGMSDDEVKTRLAYLYKLVSTFADSEIDSELIELFFLFADRLGKRKRMKNVFIEYMSSLISKEKLRMIPDDDIDTWKFSNSSRLVWNFFEDSELSDRFSIFTPKDNYYADLHRIVFAGGKEMFLRTFEYVFFTDSEEISLKKVAVAEELKRRLFTIDIGQFLLESKMLSKAQVIFLQLMYRFSTTQAFYDKIRATLNPLDVVRKLGMTERQIEEICSCQTVGLMNGLVDTDFDLQRLAYSCFAVKSLRPYFNDMSRTVSTKGAFPLKSFAVKKENSDLALSLLSSEDSVNLLLYGAAGSGKTEYAKSLIKASGLKAVRFKNSYEAENSCDAAIASLNVLLSVEKKDTVFIVDEAEGILETKPIEGMFGTVCRKGTVNKLFEHCKNKVIWIVNYTDKMDDSTKRRFTYSIPFEKIAGSNLEKIAKTRLKSLNCSSALKSRVMDLCGKYEVTGSSINNMLTVMKTIDPSDEQGMEATVRNVLESNSTLLHGQAKMRENTKQEYDVSVLNSTVPAEQIVEMVQNAKKYAETNHTSEAGIRMLFYGLSGTGKTELARYIAEKLGKRILLKRASDIISKWVGSTEKNISAAFREAEHTGQILLFDEADSFFKDRSLAQYEWEITKVNEFLTQMEEFKGILICTTNLREIMDKAMLRRFHICAEFKALDHVGIEKLVKRYFSSIKFDEKQISQIAAYNSVTPGDFGAISGKIRFLAPEKITADYIIKELIHLQKEKNGSETKPIGFVS